ncbi:MAG: carboxypeptidase regulatory-like domain-containing protein, partial [Planctomycetes bacterium]|nr:carboxypeptidase regulatory-like domain-containing protein [Planctomycetota bacterium]
ALALALPAQAPDFPTARLEGVVVDPMQRPVAGAEVVVEVDGEERARTHSDGEGTFVVGKLPQGVVVVRATTSTPDIGGTWVDLLGIDRGFAHVTTMPARKVSGTVRDRDGNSVAGAWVVSAPYDGIEFVHASCVVQADAQGHYELSHVPFGNVLLRAWAPGYDAGQATLDGAVDRQQDLIVQADGIDMQTFRLLDADAAQRQAARLVVTASLGGLPVPLPPPLRRLSPDERGEVIVRGWPRGDVIKAWFTVPGALVTPPRHTTVANVNDAHWRFHVGASAACIRGRLAGGGLRVGNRLVLVQPIAAEGSLWRVVGLTAADGSFTLPSPVDGGLDFALRLCAEDAAVAGDPQSPCWYVATHESVEHRVPIVPAASVHVRARTSEGEPARGAEVLVFAARSEPRSYPGLEEPLFAYGNVLARGVTGIDGEVTIHGLQFEPEDHISCLVLGAEGWREAVTDVPHGRRADPGPVLLQRAADVECLAGDGNSGPAPASRIALRSNRMFLQTYQRLAPGRDGKLLVRGLLPGGYAAGPLDGPRMFLLPLSAGENATVVQ